MSKSFRLRGVTYQLSREEVEDRLKHVMPRALDKYATRVNDREYPPKQVIEIALQLPVTSFTTMDASRILTSMGFLIEEMTRIGHEPVKSTSESCFEDILRASGLRDFAFEKQLPGTTRRPDYTVAWKDVEILFEVKEFRAVAEDFRPGFGAYDPYEPIRKKIEEGRRKFKDLDNYCCCLVLYNRDKLLVDLGWQYVYGAMLGNLGFSVPLQLQGSPVPSDEKTHSVFASGGKMHRQQRGVPRTPQNRTISAILVIEHLPVGKRRFRAHIRHLEQRRGMGLTVNEYHDEVERAGGTERDMSLCQLRVVVHENPYARISLPPELFRGPYDERYGNSEDRIQQLYQGDATTKLLAATDGLSAP